MVTRDHLALLPMPDLGVQKITEQAHHHGYTRSEYSTLEFPGILEDEAYDEQLLKMLIIDGIDDVLHEIAHYENASDDDEIALQAGVSASAQAQTATAAAAEDAPLAPEPSTPPASTRELRALRRDAGVVEPPTAAAPEQHSTRHGIHWSRRLSACASLEILLTREKISANRATIIRHLVLQAGTGSPKDFAFKISVNAALMSAVTKQGL